MADRMMTGVFFSMPPIPEPLAAALAGRYLFDRELGRGGMATVYLAEDRRHGRGVAIKVLRPEVAAALRARRVLRGNALVARPSPPPARPPLAPRGSPAPPATLVRV